MSRLPQFHNPPEKMEPLEDLLTQICPKCHITIISGPPYVGKSRIVEQLAESLSLGKSFLGRPPIPPLKVILFSERDARTVIREVQERNLDFSKLICVTIPDLPAIDYHSKREATIEWLRTIITHYEPDVIILDTMAKFLPSTTKRYGAFNDYGLMSDVIEQLDRFALEMNISVLAVHHDAKQKLGSEYRTHLEKSSGTFAIVAGSLAMWSLHELPGIINPDDEDEPVQYRWLQIAYHLAPPSEVYLRTLPNGSFEVTTKESATTHPTEKSNVDEAFKLIPPEGLSRLALRLLIQEKMDLGKAYAYRLIQRLLSEKKAVSVNSESGEVIKPATVSVM